MLLKPAKNMKVIFHFIATKQRQPNKSFQGPNFIRQLLVSVKKKYEKSKHQEWCLYIVSYTGFTSI